MKRRLLKKRTSVLFKFGLTLLLLITFSQLMAQLVHPGVSHTLADLERMKYMVEAEKEPWISTYNNLKEDGTASYDYVVRGDETITTVDGADGGFLSDGYASYHNALMWYITGDERHAEKCVEIYNAWKNLTSTTGIPLSQGRGPWKLVEGAEIIKHTYDGWSEEDQLAFGDMLVYPGWSGTEVPTGTTTFYWNMYQGDPARHGNQGLFAYRSMMAIGIFLDNEVIYQRGLRYIMGESHLPEDLPYPSGPPVLSTTSTVYEHFEEFQQLSISDDIEDYGYNEVMSNYIYENGQGQESSRDQAHALGGVSIMTSICEIAWTQGDDLYGHLDNRPLLGLEFYFRYNLSWEYSYPDQLTPWEPTVENGEYLQRSDRSGRWIALKVNPYLAQNVGDEYWHRGRIDLITIPIYEMNLGHYKDRMGVDSEDYKWTQRGFDILTETIGIEDGRNPVDHAGWGGIKYHRVSPGDPIIGFDGDDLPVYSMNVLPVTIEAENFDFFAADGEGRAYHDVDDTNTESQYRLDEGVDIAISTDDDGGYQLSSLEDGEWLTYTVQVPESSLYDISIRYASASADGMIKFSFDNEDVTEEVTVPFGGANSTAIDDWQDLVIASDVILRQGVQPMKITISGTSDSFVLNSITIEDGSDHECTDGLAPVEASSRFISGVDYSYYTGTFDVLPDFEALTPDASDIADAIGLVEGIDGDNYALVFEGYFNATLSGPHTFFTNSADGSRLLIDGIEVVDNDGIHAALEVSGDVCLDEGYHQIRVEYFNNTGDQSLSVEYSGPGIEKQTISELYVIGACENVAVDFPDVVEAGVSYQYYEGEFSSLPDFTTLTPVGAGNLTEISLSPSVVDDYFAMTFEGYINITEDADYTFYTNSDDGSKLYIDGIEVVNNDGNHGAKEEQGTLCLVSGYHALRVEYYEATGGSSLSVSYEGVSLEKQLITGIMTEPAAEKILQVITFPELADKVIGDEDFSPGATSNSDQPITYTSTNESVAIIVDDLIQIVSNGITTITASQEGDFLYEPAAEVTQEMTVFKVDGCVLPWIMSNVSVNDARYEFTSEPIDISCVSLTTISMSLLGTSSLAADDYLNVYYQVDGGEVQTAGELIGPSSASVSIENIEGSSLQLMFEVLSSVSSGTYQANNIAVFESVPAPVLSSDLVGGGIEIYPNPANGTITVNMAGGFEGYKLFSIHGKLVLENGISPESSKMNVDISMLPKGVYLMKLYGDQTAPTFKIFKQ